MANTLAQALDAYGLIANPIIYDGKIQRCGTLSKPHSKNGWYIVYDNGVAASFGDWQRPHETQYWSDGTTTQEYDRSAIERLKQQRDDEQVKLADDAVAYFESLAREGHSNYLKEKQIQPNGARFDSGAIVLPISDSEGKIWSHQKIYGNGDKYFMSGGRVKGCYYLIAKHHVRDDDKVIVCEGFATGASIHETTGLPVIVAFNAGNIKEVCASLPFTNILIAADNDTHGLGEQKAKESGYPYIKPESHKDFNDAARAGEDIRRYFVEQPPIATQETIIAHGLVGEIAQWITETAIFPNPLLSVAAALSFVGMVKGRRVRGYTDLRTNLLVLCLAGTATGKEHPQNCLKRLAKLTKLNHNLMGEPVSGAGFMTGLNKAGRVGLLIMDEIGRYLSNLSHKNASSHQREIIDYIIKSFSCANSTLKGRQYADDKKNPTIDIEQPHFCCLGSTVKEKLQAACGSSEIIDGFLNRWIVFNFEGSVDRRQKVKFLPPPPELVARIAELTVQSKYSAQDEPEPTLIKFTKSAWELHVDYRNKMDALIRTAEYPLDKLYGRSCEHIEKIALTVAEGDWVQERDWELAVAIVEQSNEAIKQFAGLISDNVQEQDFVRVREIIREAKEIKRSKLTVRCQFVQGGAKRIAEIVEALIDDGMVFPRKQGNTHYYKWIGASK